MDHRQCVLVSGSSRTVVWVPVPLAHAGQHVRIDEDERVWAVAESFAPDKPESILQKAARWFLRFSYGHAGKKNGLDLKQDA